MVNYILTAVIMLTYNNNVRPLNTVCPKEAVMLHQVTLKFSDHSSHVTVSPTDKHIHVFKYNARTCDFDVFEDQYEACEYILTPLTSTYYKVTFPGE